MPALTRAHAAAVRACGFLLEALDPDCPVTERLAYLRTALEAAMDATGTPPSERPRALNLLAGFAARTGESA